MFCLFFTFEDNFHIKILNICFEIISKNKIKHFWLQIWDLASGKLKLSLTGHISTVRGVIVSTRSPYLFSCGEDKQVKCWDLEYNKGMWSWGQKSSWAPVYLPSYRYVALLPSFLGYKALSWTSECRVTAWICTDHRVLVTWRDSGTAGECTGAVCAYTASCRVLARSWGLCFWIENFKILLWPVSIPPSLHPQLCGLAMSTVGSLPPKCDRLFHLHTFFILFRQVHTVSSQFPCLNWSCYLPEDRNTCFHWVLCAVL